MKTAALSLLSILFLALVAHADSQPNVDPTDPPQAPVPGPAVPACSNAGKDISADSAAILAAINGAQFCWQAVQLAENCGSGEAYDMNYVNAAAPKCQKEFESHKPTTQDRALLQTMRATCDAKWKAREGGQYQSINAYCKLKAWQWMANLTSENGQ